MWSLPQRSCAQLYVKMITQTLTQHVHNCKLVAQRDILGIMQLFCIIFKAHSHFLQYSRMQMIQDLK